MSKSANPLKLLHEQGQSLWYDNIRRQLITSGELARLRDEGIYGVTSNPTIFEKAVSGSTDYDEALVRLVKAKRKPGDILWDLMVEDIQAAADVFRPVYDESKGHDGLVSIEASPAAARSPTRQVERARARRGRRPRTQGRVKVPRPPPRKSPAREPLAPGRRHHGLRYLPQSRPHRSRDRPAVLRTVVCRGPDRPSVGRQPAARRRRREGGAQADELSVFPAAGRCGSRQA